MKILFYFQTAVSTTEIISSRRRNELDPQEHNLFLLFANPYWSNKIPGLKHMYKCRHFSKLFLWSMMGHVYKLPATSTILNN